MGCMRTNRKAKPRTVVVDLSDVLGTLEHVMGHEGDAEVAGAYRDMVQHFREAVTAVVRRERVAN